MYMIMNYDPLPTVKAYANNRYQSASYQISDFRKHDVDELQREDSTSSRERKRD
jgi:hypothetical protein